MFIVIAITNQKGGVGKTTTAVNLCFSLAKSGKKVLLIDFDPQGNATSGFGIDKQSLSSSMVDVINDNLPLVSAIKDTKYKNLYIAPTVAQLANAEVELAQADKRFVRLKNAIDSVSGDYDIVIIDCPPSLSLLTVNSLIAARFVILPVQAEFYALEGLGQLLETMKLIKKASNPQLELLGVLTTMMDSRTTLSSQVHDEIKKHFPGKVFETTIPRNIRLAEAPSHGVPVGAYDKFSKGSRAYKALAKEVLKRVES